MKKLYFLITILLITSCADDLQEVKELRIENKHLKEKLKLIENEIREFEFSATIIEKSNVVKAGEDYEAMIGLVVSKKSSPINVQLGTFINNTFQDHSLPVNETFNEYRLYRSSNSKIGKHQLSGRIEFDFFDSTIVRYFKNEYLISE